MGIREFKKYSLALKILLPLWFLYTINIVPDFSEAYYSFVILASPIVILCLEGTGWLGEYNWRNWLSFALVTYFLITLATQFLGPNIYRGLDGIREFHGKYFLIGFSLLFVLRKSSCRKCLLFGLTVSLMLGIVMAYCNYFDLSFSYYFGESHHRLTAFGRYPNAFGGYFAFFIPLLSGMALDEIGKGNIFSLSLIWHLLLLISSVPIVIWTETRAAQGASIFGFIFVLFIYLLIHKNYRVLLLLVLVMMVFFSVFAFTDGGNDALRRWSPTTDFFENSKRWTYDWPLVWKKSMERPWFGHTLSTNFFEKDTVKVAHEHNIFLFYLMRTGLLGLGSFLFFIIIFIWQTLSKILHKNKNDNHRLLGFFAAYISGVLITGSVSNNNFFWLTPLLIIFIYSRFHYSEHKNREKVKE